MRYLAGYKCPKSLVVRTEPQARTASGKVIKADVRRLALDAVGPGEPARHG